MANDEIYEWPKSNLQKGVTHKVGTGYGLDNAIISRLVLLALLRTLVHVELGSLKVFQLFVGGIIRVFVSLWVIGQPRFLSLCHYQHG